MQIKKLANMTGPNRIFFFFLLTPSQSTFSMNVETTEIFLTNSE